MGAIVGAVGMSHILGSDVGVEEQAQRVFDSFKRLGERVRASAPDLIIVVSDDHMMNIGADVQVPLAVGVAEKYETFGDLEIPVHEYPGAPDFANGLARYAAGRGFDLAKLDDRGLRLDHGYVVPLIFINPGRNIPVVPLNVNINMDPSPSPARCWQLGTTIKEYIQNVRPERERVAIVGAGGLSHWLMIERDGEISESWDQEILQTFAEGRAEEISRLTADEIQAEGGNGGTEVRNWLVMAATVPGNRGAKVLYEPVYPWKTGMAAIEMDVEEPTHS